jgi:hypothetical protein
MGSNSLGSALNNSKGAIFLTIFRTKTKLFTELKIPAHLIWFGSKLAG